LLGRELQELIRDEKLHWNLRLLSGEGEGAGTLTTSDGEEATYLEPVAEQPLRESQVIFLVGTRESGLKARELHPGGRFIDLTGTLDAPLAAPRIGVDPESQLLVIAHPASIALAFLHSKLEKAGAVERTVTTVFEPASERGHSGIGELQKQSAALLTFKPLPKDVYDAQLAYNVLPEFGEDAPLQLQAVEERIDRELKRLCPAEHASLRLVQVPVFHGYSFLTWVRFTSAVASLEPAFAADPLVDLRGDGVEPPTNAGVTQQDGYQIGAIRRDRADANAWWVWMTCDNLRTVASNAVAAAKQIL
jgi:aspartate-semialdehyde dehydrogenase